jgi:thiosulfate dehydrogenase [quinone] large subunit
MADESVLLPASSNGMRNLRIANFLFRSKRSSVLWLIVRLWLGWQWLDAGWDKFHGSGYSDWMTHSQGLLGFIGGANASWANRAQTFGHPEVPYHWVLTLLNNDIAPHALFFSRVITIAELLVGIGLLLGCFTAIAAAGGIALNLVYVTSGSAGPNAIFILLSMLLIAAWRVAGYLGLDYFVLPMFGPREQRGLLFRGRRPVEPPLAVAQPTAEPEGASA